MSNPANMTLAEVRRGLQHFAAPSNARGFVTIAADWLVIALAFACWTFVASRWQSPTLRFSAWIIEIMVLASRIRGLESLTHEATHATLFRTRHWNVSMQWLYALPMLHEVRAYRSEHIVHHWRLGAESDPAQLFFARHGVTEFPRRALWVMFIRPLLGYHSLMWLRDRRDSWTLIPQFRAPIALFWGVSAIAVGVTHQLSWILLHWLVALGVVFPVMEFWSEVSDHAGVSPKHLGWCRNNLGLLHGLFVHAHQDGYHSAHHLNPAIPGHRLAEAHMYLRRVAAPDTILESHGVFETFRQIRLSAGREPAGRASHCGARASPDSQDVAALGCAPGKGEFAARHSDGGNEERDKT